MSTRLSILACLHSASVLRGGGAFGAPDYAEMDMIADIADEVSDGD